MRANNTKTSCLSFAPSRLCGSYFSRQAAKLAKFCAVAVFTLLLFPPLAAQEKWLRVATSNFELSGNAAEIRLRATARNLEQFREFFRQSFPKLNLASNAPLRLIVFDSPAAFAKFQPLRADGRTDADVAGYFQAGLDADYIVFPSDEKSAAPSTVYHEYVHFVLSNNLRRAEIPSWLNEGLAEYFQSFRLENDSRVVIGEAQPALVRLLETETLIPLETFFKTDNFALKNQGKHGRSLFYAQSWLLMHYLRSGERQAKFENFVELLLSGKSASEAFQKAFQINYAALDNELKKYLAARNFQVSAVDLKTGAISENSFKATPLAEADRLAILGNLLLQQNRFAEATSLFENAVAAEPENSAARAALGVALARQNKFAEAERHFEKALAANGKTSFLPAFYYAYALSKQETDQFGYLKSLPPAKAKKMRELLRQSLELNPNFAEAYYLLGIVNLITGENLPEAVELFQKAIRLKPENLRYLLDLAQTQLRLTNYAEAEILAEKVFQQTAEKDLRLNAQAVTISARRIRERLNNLEIEEINAPEKPHPVISQEEGLLQAFNEALRKPLAGEQRFLGVLTDVECTGKSSTFAVRNNETAETFIFNAPELQKVRMISFAPNLEGQQIGCETGKFENPVVLTFRPAKETRAKFKGEVVTIEFVPPFFRFLNNVGVK